MTTLNLTLLREKIAVLDCEGSAEPIAKALSNRMTLTLTTGMDKFTEYFVIRAHSMHICARMASAILQEFLACGFLANRLYDHQWASMWHECCSSHDIVYNPERWATVYHDGKPIFSSASENPLIASIESRQAKAGDTGYDQAIFLIQDTCEYAGHTVRIEYDSNIGLVSALTPEKGRCSLILRGPGRTTTFSFAATPRSGAQKINMPQCLIGCAAFLEGIQLSYTVGRALGQMDRGDLSKTGPESRMVIAARKQINSLDREIRTMEATTTLRYRPDRPEFQQIIVDVQEQTKRSGLPRGRVQQE